MIDYTYTEFERAFLGFKFFKGWDEEKLSWPMKVVRIS